MACQVRVHSCVVRQDHWCLLAAAGRQWRWLQAQYGVDLAGQARRQQHQRQPPRRPQTPRQRQPPRRPQRAQWMAAGRLQSRCALHAVKRSQQARNAHHHRRSLCLCTGRRAVGNSLVQRDNQGETVTEFANLQFAAQDFVDCISIFPISSVAGGRNTPPNSSYAGSEGPSPKDVAGMRRQDSGSTTGGLTPKNTPNSSQVRPQNSAPVAYRISIGSAACFTAGPLDSDRR